MEVYKKTYPASLPEAGYEKTLQITNKNYKTIVV